MPIEIYYQPGGKVTFKPVDYPEEKCYEAARPYELARPGEYNITTGEAQARVSLDASINVSKTQKQRVD